MNKGIGSLLRDLSMLDFTRIRRAKRFQIRRDSIVRELRFIRSEALRKQNRIDRLDRKIRALLKSNPRENHNRYEETLDAAILGVLGASRKPLGLTELAKALLEKRRKTKSDFNNFRTSVAHSLRNLRSRLDRTEDGYSLKRRVNRRKARSARMEEPQPRPGGKDHTPVVVLKKK